MSDHFQLSLTDTAISLDRVSKVPKTTQVVITSRLGASARVGVTLVTNPGDAPLQSSIEPREFTMEDGETREVTVTLTPGDTDVDAEVEARVQAYDVEAPQEKFTTSGPLVVSVKQVAAFPWWIVAVAAGALLLVILLILGFVFGWFSGDPEPQPSPTAIEQASFEMPDLIGAHIDDVAGKLTAAGGVVQHALGIEEGATEGVCVIFQTPAAGASVAEGDEVDVVVTGCPDEDVTVEEPTDDATLCASVPSFCDALDEDVPGSAAQQAVLADQLTRFVKRFEVEGVEVPAMVGKKLALADEIARVGRIEYVTIPANSTDGCVLYQVPFDGTQVPTDYILTLVLAKCPILQELPTLVEIAPAELADAGDVCPSLGEFCETLGVESSDLALRFTEYLETFRGTFSAHLVPKLDGKYVYRARQLLAERGLTLQVVDPPPGNEGCMVIEDQLIGSGVPADQVPGGVVRVRVASGSPAPMVGASFQLGGDFLVERFGDSFQDLILDPCLFALVQVGP